MKQFFSLLAAMSIAVCSYAQSGGKVTGSIKDGGNQKIIDAASISLLRAKDSSLVKAAVADKDGNFNDAAYGKIPVAHLFSTHHFVGDKVTLNILRAGERKTLDVELSRRSPSSFVSEPYIIDRHPRFVVVGGLILRYVFLRHFQRNRGPARNPHQPVVQGLLQGREARRSPALRGRRRNDRDG